VKAVFSARFKAELLDAEAKYCEVSDRLAGELRERVAGQAREIIRWNGGDHVGPHGFPCRRTKPFPFSFTTKRGATRFTFSAWFTNDATPIF